MAKTDSIAAWQQTYNNEITGRVTHEYLPDIDKRLKMKYFNKDFHLTQISGHDKCAYYPAGATFVGGTKV